MLNETVCAYAHDAARVEVNAASLRGVPGVAITTFDGVEPTCIVLACADATRVANAILLCFED